MGLGFFFEMLEKPFPPLLAPVIGVECKARDFRHPLFFKEMQGATSQDGAIAVDDAVIGDGAFKPFFGTLDQNTLVFKGSQEIPDPRNISDVCCAKAFKGRLADQGPHPIPGEKLQKEGSWALPVEIMHAAYPLAARFDRGLKVYP